MFEPPVDPNSKAKLVAIKLDEASIGHANANIEHEREVAIFDILESNRFELEGRDVTDRIRAEDVSDAASKIAGLASVRQGLLRFQRSIRRKPGLVAEGRDMGSMVFPDAILKIFLTASVEERARRRYKQLKEKGFDANLADLLQDIALRDRRDSERSLAPLQKSADAQLLETTGLSIEESVSQVVQWFESVRRQAPSR